MRANGLRCAGRGRKAAAGVLDSLPFVVIIVATRRTSGPRLRCWDLAVTALDGLYRIGLTVARGQTFGQTALGLRVVDPTTGDPPTWRWAAAWWAATSLVPLPASLLPTPPGLLALRDLQPEIERLRREHRGDRRTLNNELMALYRSRHVSPWAGLPKSSCCKSRLGGPPDPSEEAYWGGDGRVAQLADRRA